MSGTAFEVMARLWVCRSAACVACKAGALLTSKRRAKRRSNERLPVMPLIQNLPTFNLSLNRPIKIVPEVK